MGALERAAGALDLDPARLEAIEERLFSLRTAARKFRTEPDSLEHLRDDYAVKLDVLEAGEDRLDRLSVECRGAREAYLACSETLTAARRSAARALDEALLRELKPQKLEAARFATNIEPLAPERHHKGELGLLAVLATMTARPAELLGLPCGRLSPGAPADLVLIDLDTPWRVEVDRFRSKSKNSPFDERPVQGRAVRTVVGGETVYRYDPDA